MAWHVARWAISIHFEEQAQEGQLPWWRGGLVAFNGIVFCCWGLFETWGASLAAERSTWLTEALATARHRFMIAATAIRLSLLHEAQQTLYIALRISWSPTVHTVHDLRRRLQVTVTTSLHDSKDSNQLSLLHEAKPTKNTAIAAAVAVLVQSRDFPMRARVVAQRGAKQRPGLLGRRLLESAIVRAAK
eukprot:s6487_g2.t1